MLQLNRMLWIKQCEKAYKKVLIVNFTSVLVSNQALSVLGVSKLSDNTATHGKCHFISNSKLASDPAFQIRAFDLLCTLEWMDAYM